MPTPVSWKVSDVAVLDVTCGMLLSLERDIESLPFTSSESHCTRLPQPEALS